MKKLKEIFSSLFSRIGKLITFIIDSISILFSIAAVVLAVMICIYGIDVKFGHVDKPVLEFYINKNGESTKKLIEYIKGDSLKHEKEVINSTDSIK